MTMIIKATKIKSVRHADLTAKHLLRADENELVEVVDIRGTARPDDLAASLRSMQRATELTKGKTGLFHVAINPRDHEADRMTPDEWERTLQAIEDEFNLAGQPCAIIEHRKNGRSHLHAVYQLTDTDKGKLIDTKNDHYRCQTLGRQLEQEFSHELTTNEPSRDSYTRDEQQHAKRLDEKVPDRRAGLRADYAQANDLDEFRQLLEAKGYTIAQGDRAGVVLVDKNGEVFGLTRELGIKAAEAKRLLGSEIDHLPTVEQAKAGPQRAVEPEQSAPVDDTVLRDIADSQDVAAAMINQYRQKAEPQPEPSKIYSYGFTFDQPLTPAPLPAKEPEKQPEPQRDISDSQDMAEAMLERYRQRQTDKQRVQGTKQQANDNQADITDQAAKMLEDYRRKQEERKRQRDRGLEPD